MSHFNSILIFGCGNMGGAMLAGWLAGGIDPACFTVVDPVLAEAPAGVTLLRELSQGPFDAILLGIKPQLLDQLIPQLQALAGPQTTVLSILAGVELATLARHFPLARGQARIMPNLAAAIGKSPMGVALAKADPALQADVAALLAPLGAAEWIADEAEFDLVTALAGSGPAFVYRFIDALATGAAALGMDRTTADRLALEMVTGAAQLAAAAADSPAELARKVASPGGTTAEGLRVLDHEAALVSLLTETLRAAQDRSAEMARAAR